MTNIDWAAKVKEALDRTDIMALSTIGPDGSWTSPVQYRYSEKLNLYFVSLKSSRHVTNILHDIREFRSRYTSQSRSQDPREGTSACRYEAEHNGSLTARGLKKPSRI